MCKWRATQVKIALARWCLRVLSPASKMAIYQVNLLDNDARARLPLSGSGLDGMQEVRGFDSHRLH